MCIVLAEITGLGGGERRSKCQQGGASWVGY